MSTNLTNQNLVPRTMAGAGRVPPAEGRSFIHTVRGRLALLFRKESNDNTGSNPAYLQGSSPKLIQAIDEFFAILDQFQDEESFIQSESEEIVRRAFEKFLDKSGLLLSKLSFPILLDEKNGEFAYRDDGVTPNWYHELREACMLLSLIRSGKLSEELLEPHGGVDTALASILRHDSWEDFGKDPSRIQKALQEKIDAHIVEKTIRAHKLLQAGVVDPELNIAAISRERKALIEKSLNVEMIIDLVSRKEPLRDGDGQPVIDPETGKIKTIPRYNGDMNKYFNRQLDSPIAVLVKYLDTIEGTSTLLGIYDHNKNMRYSQKIWSLYGRRHTKEIASEKWPNFKEAFHSADNMLGCPLAILDGVNDYNEFRHNNPREGKPISTRGYTDEALEGFWPAPRCIRPDLTAIGRVEKMAKTSARMRDVLEHVIYPSRGVQLLMNTVRTHYKAPPSPEPSHIPA